MIWSCGENFARLCPQRTELYDEATGQVRYYVHGCGAVHCLRCGHADPHPLVDVHGRWCRVFEPRELFGTLTIGYTWLYYQPITLALEAGATYQLEVDL